MKEIRLTPVPTVRVPSDQASRRTLQRRNASAKQALSQISGESSSAQSTQTTSLIKSLDESQRESITKSLGHEIMIPPSHVASLKSNLLIPWNMMRDISRWLKTFNVTLSSEKRVRAVATDWVGDGLKSELVPLTVRTPGTKRITIELKPWAYVYNLVGHILHRLDELDSRNDLVNHPFIPSDEIHIKIGGDHGDISFKMSYQIANVANPNRKDNTVVFSIFEGKDSKANLRTCLERFKPQINMLHKVKWRNRSIKVFMFGDYEFLGTMYGLSGSNGKQSIKKKSLNLLFARLSTDLIKNKEYLQNIVMINTFLKTCNEFR